MAADTKIILTAVDKTRAAFDSAKASMGGLTASAAKLNGLLSTLGVGAIAGGGMVAFVKQSIDAADNLNDLSKKTGVAVENLAGLQLVVDKSGTTMEMLANGVGKLNKTMGEAANGNEEAKRTLKDLGITATDPMEAFYQLADAFGRFRNEGDKALAMSRIIGKTWQELAPALAEGGDGLRSMVEEGKRLNPITKEMAEQADKFNDAMSRFKTEIAGVGTTLTIQLLPALNSVLQQLNEGTRAFGGYAAAMELGTRNPFKTYGQHINELNSELRELETKKASIKPTSISHILVSGIDEDIAKTKQFLEYYKAMQGSEALALNDKYGTGDYKMPKAPGQPSISLSGSTSAAKEAKPKLDTLMTERDRQLRAAQIAEYKALAAAEGEVFDVQMENEDARVKAETESLKNVMALRAEYLDLIDPVQKYRDKLNEIDMLQEQGGPFGLSAEQATEARMRINEQIDGLNQTNSLLKDGKSIAEELGMTFSSAFEDAIVSGKGFRDILNGIYQDLLRITIRKTVTEPLSSGFSSLLGSVNWSAMLPKFATGTDYVPRDMIAVVHKGEAIIPAAQNRGGAGGINITMNVVTQDAGSFRKSMGQIQADLAFAVSGARRFQ